MPSRAQRNILYIGINNVLADDDAATIESQLTSLMGVIPDATVVCLMPFGGYTGWTSAREAVRREVNIWIKANAPRAVDTESMGDGDADQPSLITAYDFGDGLHLVHNTGDAALALLIMAAMAA